MDILELIGSIFGSILYGLLEGEIRIERRI
jgi:hypothetical protein